MTREKIYRQNLSKRIRFLCRFCNQEMVFSRSPKRVVIECKRCGIYFVITGEVKAKFTNVVLWSNTGSQRK